MKVYLIIFEDGSMGHTTKMTQDLKNAAADGVLDIICITDMTRFHSAEMVFEKIQEIDT